MHEKGFTISKTAPNCKKLKIRNILSLQASNLGPKMGHRRSTFAFRSRFVECRQVGHNSCDRTKYAVPRQIKPEILKLTTNRVQSNLPTAFIFVSCEEKGYYRVVLVGQLSSDLRSYCGRSRHMQVGKDSWILASCFFSFLRVYGNPSRSIIHISRLQKSLSFP